jgi:hypothetical protein
MTAPGPALDAVNVTDQRTITVALPDGLDPLEVEHSSIGRMFRPTSLLIRWARTDDRPWHLSEVTARGPVLRKDGSDAQAARGARRLSRWGVIREGSLAMLPDAPEWAVNAVTLTSPAVMTR